MIFSIIVAIARNKVIGRNGTMPWRLKTDLQRFKNITINSPIIMGRVTWETLPAPLKNRSHIILTQDATYEIKYNEAFIVHTVEEAKIKAIAEAKKLNTDEIFIIGGSQIYNLFLQKNLVDRLYVTWVLDNPIGDTMFNLSLENWSEIHKQEIAQSEKDSSKTIFNIYEKNN